jgi:ATP-dependent helicase HrpA
MAGVRDAPVLEELRRLIPRCLLPDQLRLGHRLLALRRAGGPAANGAALARWLAEARASAAVRERRAAILRGLAYPPELPITAHKDALVAALRTQRVVIVAGETGSGKTTQLPKMCLEAGLGLRARIGCTQPRRVAALAISRRLAEELGVTWGREVGCKIRFTDATRPETSVKVMTDGILLAELQGDPWLAEYEALILDEAHERSLNIDFLLGYLRGLLERRDDLKLVITSATLDTALFARAFGGAPVFTVSGRSFPVEVRYQPLDEAALAAGELTEVDAAVAAVGRLLDETPAGDVLVFLPGERDIREACDRLAADHGDRVEVVPLFGRLAAGDQQRVFQPGPRRRVVVATNIAETSLTVPRIRYVVDSGLARISRYHPGARTHRLPIEPISQSSANQRAGRCGRVAPGVCVRLYSEADFHARPAFTEPEIRRCDLAEVILRLKAWGLGEVETFPFLEPPTPAAVHAAYQLLQELGALDDARALTPLGRELARLPVDPAIGRMLLQARAEGVLPEVLIIAAGLSIQDPRERPLEQRDAAAAAHRRFQHPQSDFLTLLQLWRAYHDTWAALQTQSQMRRFCRAHFLSYVRMREWQDVHAELEDALAALEEARPATPAAPARPPPAAAARPGRSAFDARYAAIHRAILTGLWGHVLRREARNLYRTPAGRQVMVFPGSALFHAGAETTAARSARAAPAEPATSGGGQPEWLVAGEIVETSRPFARTVAAIDPAWVIELAPHLVRTTHDLARWDAAAGRVLARERVWLRGLVLRERTVSYGQVNPAEATALFIREALVAADHADEAAAAGASADSRPPHRGAPRGDAAPPPRTEARAAPAVAPPPRVRQFLEHNRRLREKIELWQTRLRHRVAPDLDEALYQFYAARLAGVSSWPDLDRVLQAAPAPDFLCARPADLLGEHAAAFAAEAFPDTLTLAGHPVAVRYAYAPGREDDGVTLRLAVPLAELVDPAALEWAVPALREERIAHLLRELPRALRRPLQPLNDAAREIAAHVPPAGGDYPAALSAFVRQRYGVDIPVSAWALDRLPAHLRPRVELVTPTGQTVAAGRDLAALRAEAAQHRARAEAGVWERAARQWERYDVRAWAWEELPAELVVGTVDGFAVRAWPGLQVEADAVHLRLFRSAAAAAEAHRRAVPRLAERVLHRELAAVQKDLRRLREHGVLHATLGPVDELLETAWENLRRHLLPAPDPPPRTAAAFAAYLESVRARLPGAVAQLHAAVGAILEQRQAALLGRRPWAGLAAELNALVPRRFLAAVPFERLPHLPRYLRALRVRAERAALDPAKDAAKAARVRPYVEVLQTLAPAARSEAARAAWHRLRWLVEEYKVAVFAPELGTAEKVSPARLDAAVVALRRAAAEPAGP